MFRDTQTVKPDTPFDAHKYSTEGQVSIHNRANQILEMKNKKIQAKKK